MGYLNLALNNLALRFITGLLQEKDHTPRVSVLFPCSLRASSPFGGVVSSHARAACERSAEYEGHSRAIYFVHHKWRAF